MSNSSLLVRKNVLQFLVFFAVLPAFLISLGWNFLSGQYFARQKEDALEQMKKGLTFVRREGGNEFFIQKQLNWFYGLLSEEKIDKATIQEHLNRFRSSGLNFLNFRFFDEKRNHIPLEGESDSYRVLIKKIFSALSQPETEGESKLLASYKSFFEAFLGDVSPGDIVYEKSSLVKVKLNGKPGYFYWNSIYSNVEGGKFKGGMIVFFEESAIPRDLAVKSLISILNKESKGETAYGFLNLANLEESFAGKDSLAAYGLTRMGLAEEINKMRSDFCSDKKFGDSILATLQLDADRELFAVRKVENDGNKKIAFLIKILIFFCFFALAKTIFNYCSGNSMPEILVSKRTEILIAYVVAIPLLAFLVLGVHYIANFKRVFSQELYAHLSSYISSVDENFSLAVSELEKKYQGLARELESGEKTNAQVVFLCSELKKSDSINRMYILDSEGKIQFSWPESSPGSDLLKKLVPTIGRKLFVTKLGKEQSWKSRVNDMMFDSISDSFSELVGGDDGKSNFLKVFEKVDQVVEFWFANKRYYVFSRFLVNNDNPGNKRLMFVWQETRAFSERYLQGQIRRVQELPRQQQPIRIAMMSRSRNLPPFPREFTKYPFSNVIFEQVVSTEAQKYSIEEMDGEKWLVLASPLKRVPDYVLFAMYPIEKVENELFRFLQAFIFVAISSVFVAIFVARLMLRPRD